MVVIVMNNSYETNGEKIRSLLRESHEQVSIIAPYIKTRALKSLLEVIPNDTNIMCVTCWHPIDVASGYSDPEIIELFGQRGNFSIYLVDNLHAKIYIAGVNCLVGSSNVTLAGFGESENSNIEILIKTDIYNSDVKSVLSEIMQNTKPATFEIAKSIRRIADSIDVSSLSLTDSYVWLPKSRTPEKSFDYYCNPPSEHLFEVDRILLQDIATANFQPGLSMVEYNEQIRLLLLNFPFAHSIIENPIDRIISFEDSHSYFEEYSGDGFSSEDLWIAFVKWMVYFFEDEVMEKEITKKALRRAKKVK